MAANEHASVITGADAEPAGPLARTVLDYTRDMRYLVPTIESADGWAPLEVYIAVDEFERTGTFLEVQNWREYTEMLTMWASATDSFETTVRRIAELERPPWSVGRPRGREGREAESPPEKIVAEASTRGGP